MAASRKPPAKPAMSNGTNGDWKSLIAIISIVVAVISPIYSQIQGQWTQISEVRNEQKATHDRFIKELISNAEHRGRLYERLDAITERQDKNVDDIADVDEDLQREMRDLIRTVDVKSEQVDGRLQGEIRTAVGLLENEIARSRELDQTFREAQQVLREKVARLNERLSSRESTP